MGVSTDAILFYGYCWDDEDVHDWESRYARAKGCLPPEVPFPERTVPRTRENNYSSTPKDYSAAEQAIIDQYTAYWEAKEKLVEEAPCLVDSHCSASCPMPYVAVKASITKAWRGHPKQVAALVADPVWQSQMDEFCALMKIDVSKKKIGWWLVSWWDE